MGPTRSGPENERTSSAKETPKTQPKVSAMKDYDGSGFLDFRPRQRPVESLSDIAFRGNFRP